jgi:hypothetical protein
MSEHETRHEYSYRTAPGQRPLLEFAPCDCDPKVVERFMDSAVGASLHMMEEHGLCSLSVATGLALVAGSLFNPVNYREPIPKDIVQRTCDMASILETIAKGMRQRVGY